MKPMLATTYERQDVTGWLMSEKLDGVRAIWTGSRLISRNGNEFAAPQWFTDGLPSGVMLDGELWMGRGKFQQTAGIVRKKTPVDEEWKQIKFMVFDAPEFMGGFSDRLQSVTGLSLVKSFQILPHFPCFSSSRLADYFREIVQAGGEGVMLRDPLAPYEPGKRSKSLLKFKPCETEEGEMLGIELGEGKNSGRAGAFLVKWKGRVVKLGTGISDLLRDAPPLMGSKITFSFEGLTDGGMPRFPAFVGVRDYE
jgi:DNA ligase-1